MKKILFYIVTIIVLTNPGISSGSESADISLEMSTTFTGFANAPKFSARAKGTIEYEMAEGEAILISASIPQFIYEVKKPPLDYEYLTLIITSPIQINPNIVWKDYPQVGIKNMALNIKAYNLPPEEITRNAKSIAEVDIFNINLSTSKVESKGIESEGYIDFSDMEIMLVGKIRLPKSNLEDFNEYLAGETILLELKTNLSIHLKSNFKQINAGRTIADNSKS